MIFVFIKAYLIARSVHAIMSPKRRRFHKLSRAKFTVIILLSGEGVMRCAHVRHQQLPRGALGRAFFTVILLVARHVSFVSKQSSELFIAVVADGILRYRFSFGQGGGAFLLGFYNFAFGLAVVYVIADALRFFWFQLINRIK